METLLPIATRHPSCSSTTWWGVFLPIGRHRCVLFNIVTVRAPLGGAYFSLLFTTAACCLISLLSEHRLVGGISLYWSPPQRAVKIVSVGNVNFPVKTRVGEMTTRGTVLARWVRRILYALVWELQLIFN